jgi:RNA polymerase sigma factor (sigma-70 family)
VKSQDAETDTAADFAEFFAGTRPGMLAKAIMLSGHRQDAEDAVQEAYTEAFRSWHRVGGYESPEAWVYKVMNQRLWKASRRQARQTPSGLELTVSVPSQADPERTAEARAVIGALGALPGKMRFVMVLHCLNGMSQEEVARELGLARGTVAVYVHTARRLLEKTLGMTPVHRRTDQPLVSVPLPSSGRFPGPDLKVGDPLALALRATENWLREGIEDDDRDTARLLRTAIAAGRSDVRVRTSRWAPWRSARAARTPRRSPGTNRGGG